MALLWCNFSFPKVNRCGFFILIYPIISPLTPKGLIKSIKTKFVKIIFTSIFWKPFMNFHPFLLLYNYLKLVLSYQTFILLIFQENIREEPPCLLLHYSYYNHLLKWWLNLQCCLFPAQLKPMRPKMISGSHMILMHAWCEMSMMKCHERQACEKLNLSLKRYPI